MNRPVLSIKRLSELATLPAYQSAEAAGMDLHAAIEQTIEIEPGAIVFIPLGFAMALPPGFEGQVRPRSGLASRHGITLPNAPGTIDSDYRGEVKIPLVNLGDSVFTIERGMRIAQMIIAPVVQAELQEVDDLDDSERGEGGFGSTGQ
jgi:dUTP pyrophosphatase